MQSVDLIGTPRPSVVVELDAGRTLARLEMASQTSAIAAAIGADPAIVVVDAPLAVPNERGQRDVERILAWCDAPAFPVSRARLAKVHGGLRGVDLAERLPSTVTVAETHPDVVLRLLMWEDGGGGAPIDLLDYRARWLGIRAPVYRPKGPGRATITGIVTVSAILARHVELGGWTATESDDDWGPIRDAAILDAIICAYVAHRSIHTPEATLTIGTRTRGRMLLPVDSNLRGRLEATVARLSAERVIGGGDETISS